VRRASDRLRVTAQLIDASTGAHGGDNGVVGLPLGAGSPWRIKGPHHEVGREPHEKEVTRSLLHPSCRQLALLFEGGFGSPQLN
jgi:hypothetical protein